MHEFTAKLSELKEEKEDFREFSEKIISDTSLKIMGVKIPKIRELAKTLNCDKATLYGFFGETHVFLEEQLLHGFLLARLKDVNEIYALIGKFLSGTDSWAVTDSVAAAMKILAKDKPRLLENVKGWLSSEKPYTVRFAVVMLLDYLINDLYVDTALELASEIKDGRYYVDMAVAWLYSVALVKFYDKTVPILERKTLPRFIQNKAISKATDSFRITKDKKEYLKTLKT